MIEASRLFLNIPSRLRDPLIQSYSAIASNYIECRWEPAELNGGKFSEVVHAILSGYLSGTYAAHPSKLKNMKDACSTLEQLPADPNRVGDRSVRILIPRALQFLYEIRNNRGVGHVGGDVNPNQQDATTVYAGASWIMAELVRIFYSVSLAEAQDTVEALIVRPNPLVWQVGNVKRVLNNDLSVRDQVLLLLHQSIGWVLKQELADWVEFNKPSMFASRVLRPLHSERLIEFDSISDRARISPLGIDKIEKVLRARPDFS